MGEKKVRLACIASGEGTDFFSIASDWRMGLVPEVSSIVLISTKEGAGCLEKADKLEIKHKAVKPVNKELPLRELAKAFTELGGVDLVFLVGCNVKVPEITCIREKVFNLPVYNIHPADPHKHGGQGMYGKKVHLHVLNEIKDLVMRGMAKPNDRFFTTPVVHEAASEYDKGKELLRTQVEIPQAFIQDWLLGKYEGKEEEAADILQKMVLPYEWLMLPGAVRLAACKILDAQNT